MALVDTGLIIQAGALPTTFKGTPQQLFVEMIRRMKIVSASGASFFIVSDVEPTSNVGPWFKGGTQLWVFSEETKRYVPLDISASETRWFHMGASTPTSAEPPVWLRTTQDQTTTDSSFGQPIGWLEWNGTAWVPFNSIPRNGSTADRPTGPVDYQQYFDTDINVLIHFERGKWRCVAGSPGDTKFVMFETLEEALEFNPGFALVGASNQAFRGRVFSQATADSGGGNPISTGTDVPQRQAFETFFSTVTAGAVNIVPALALWCLVKE